MGLLLPFILLKTSSDNTLQLFNKINNTILELENKNKADKDKYENDIAVLNEKNKNLEESLEKERITNQELKNNNNNLELLKIVFFYIFYFKIKLLALNNKWDYYYQLYF